MKRITTARPPITPPTIAPVGVWVCAAAEASRAVFDGCGAPALAPTANVVPSEVDSVCLPSGGTTPEEVAELDAVEPFEEP